MRVGMLLCPKYSISVNNPLSPAVAPSAECYRLRATNREELGSDGRIALPLDSIRFIINHDYDPLQAFPQQTAPSLKVRHRTHNQGHSGKLDEEYECDRQGTISSDRSGY
jgi:hypothetical protein